jgi:hypothetical protein
VIYIYISHKKKKKKKNKKNIIKKKKKKKEANYIYSTSKFTSFDLINLYL